MKQIPMVKHFEVNVEGRDFACGDIHGYFRVLDDVLAQVNFDKTKDRLFSVGDLVDRGPHSIEFSDYIYQDWFKAVRGNHETMKLQRGHDNRHHVQNGGLWFVDEWTDSRNEIRLHIGSLPVAIDVQTKHGLVGIVHADVPGNNWDFFVKALVDYPEEIVNYATWNRSRWRYKDRESEKVQMVDKVIVGHCAHENVRYSENVVDIDTGCGYEGGKLTLWSIDDWGVAAEGFY